MPAETITLVPFPNTVEKQLYPYTGMLLAQLLHISASYIPGLNTTLQLDPITFYEWLKLVPTPALVLVVELFKHFRRKRLLTGPN